MFNRPGYGWIGMWFSGLLVGIGVGWWMLRRHGERQASAAQSGVDVSFKRVFPLSHSSILAPLDVWLPRLFAARFRV
ncbi:hypothetical protein LCGC14_2329250, partial [marine sediment metagenome]